MKRLFKPEDFEASFGITRHDYDDIQNHLTWYQLCQRAADAANLLSCYGRKFLPETRVVIDYYGIKIRGTVTEFRANTPGQILVFADGNDGVLSVWPSQCKKLIPKRIK